MAQQKKPLRKRRTPSPRPGKPYFLATMDRELIKNLKLAAIEDEKSASECLEDATQQWLERQDLKALKASER
jgi:hypothetical protein